MSMSQTPQNVLEKANKLVGKFFENSTDVVKKEVRGKEREFEYLSSNFEKMMKEQLGYDNIRFILDGSVITLEYIPTRLNIELSKGKVKKVYLG